MITKKEVFYAQCDSCGLILFASKGIWAAYFESMKDVETQMETEGWQLEKGGKVICNHCWTRKTEKGER